MRRRVLTENFKKNRRNPQGGWNTGAEVKGPTGGHCLSPPRDEAIVTVNGERRTNNGMTGYAVFVFMLMYTSMN